MKWDGERKQHGKSYVAPPPYVDWANFFTNKCLIRTTQRKQFFSPKYYFHLFSNLLPWLCASGSIGSNYRAWCDIRKSQYCACITVWNGMFLKLMRLCRVSWMLFEWYFPTEFKSFPFVSLNYAFNQKKTAAFFRHMNRTRKNKLLLKSQDELWMHVYM